jgi:hypothetical protein
MALKSPGRRARANPTEALIPDQYGDYRDPYDGRNRGEKPYIGLGNAVRTKITEDLWTSVRWLQPGDLVDWGGVYEWTEKHFPSYDPDMDDGVHDVSGLAISSLVKHGFLRRDSDFVLTRTSKPPHTAFSIFSIDASCWPDTNGERTKRFQKRVAKDREILRGHHTEEVVNTAYAEGPTLEEYKRIDTLTGVHGAPGVADKLRLTDAGYMNPTAEMIAHVATIKECYRVIGEKRTKEQAETERFAARIGHFDRTATPERKQAVGERARYLDNQLDRMNRKPFMHYLQQAMDELEKESQPWE